jgi:hypothetical protein
MKMSISKLRPAVKAYNEAQIHFVVNSGKGKFGAKTAGEILDELYPDPIDWHHAAARVIDMGRR